MYKTQNWCGEADSQPLQKVYVGFFHFSFFVNFGGKLLFSENSKLLKFSKIQIFLSSSEGKSGIELVWMCAQLPPKGSLLLYVIIKFQQLSSFCDF